MHSPHPVADLSTLLYPRANDQARRLMATPGLEFAFSGRGALALAFLEIARARRGAKVLLPGFHCPSAIAPALLAGLQPVFYRIRRDLTIDHEDLLLKADRGVAAVLVIHYFGIAPDIAALAPLRDQGVMLVEDCSHSFMQVDPLRFAGHPSSEYRTYSFWKTVPSGVGGGLLRSPMHPSTQEPASRHHAPWHTRLRNYKLLLEDSVEHYGPHALRHLLHGLESLRAAGRRSPRTVGHVAPDPMRGEDYYPIDIRIVSSEMPRHCRRIIEAFDLEAIAMLRRAHFSRFAGSVDRLAPMRPIVRALPNGACPWVFPVLLRGRPQIDFRLKAAGVPLHTFGIYLHSALFEGGDKRVISDARFLAEHVLCLAIHQNLSSPRIDAIVDIIDRELQAVR